MSEIEKPNYYSVIPANVRYDKSLTPLEKLLYGEITALANEKGFCWATNEYFANIYGKSVNWISKSISKLEKCGYVSIKIKDNYRRKIYIRPLIKSPSKSRGGIGVNYKGGCRKLQGGDWRKLQDNNIYINNIDNNYTLLAKTLTDDFYLLIKSNNPHISRTPTTRDYRIVDALLKKYPKEVVGGVMVWCQADSFWQSNVLSASGLKKHFEKLYAKANAQGRKVITV